MLIIPTYNDLTVVADKEGFIPVSSLQIGNKLKIYILNGTNSKNQVIKPITEIIKCDGFSYIRFGIDYAENSIQLCDNSFIKIYE